MTPASPPIVRLARPGDLPGLLDLAASADSTMTTIPHDPDAMAAKLDAAVASVAADRVVDGSETYLFVLEEAGRIVGLSAIYATVGVDRPFYSYKVSSISQASPDLGVRVDTRLLHLVNDYAGAAVVGTLFLHPAARGGGRGRLLSLTRFVFMAAHRERFGDRVMAEMRGLTLDDGRSPFWDAVGKRFFQREFPEADLRRGHEFRHICELFPTYPIYADLLPAAAQAVIGRTHPEAEPAVRLLEEQGLRNHGYVDIFDAGLCLHAFIDDLNIVRRGQRALLSLDGRPGSPGPDQPPWLATATELDAFTVVHVPAPIDVSAGGITVDEKVARSLGWEAGRSIYCAPSKCGAPWQRATPGNVGCDLIEEHS